jgi:hypothetical protein
MNNTYKIGKDRQQALLFSPSLDEIVTQDNPVRAINSYVDMLDVLNLGFSNKTTTTLDSA